MEYHFSIVLPVTESKQHNFPVECLNHTRFDSCKKECPTKSNHESTETTSVSKCSKSLRRSTSYHTLLSRQHAKSTERHKSIENVTVIRFLPASQQTRFLKMDGDGKVIANNVRSSHSKRHSDNCISYSYR